MLLVSIQHDKLNKVGSIPTFSTKKATIQSSPTTLIHVIYVKCAQDKMGALILEVDNGHTD